MEHLVHIATLFLLFYYATGNPPNQYIRNSLGISTTTLVSSHQAVNNPIITYARFDQNSIGGIPSGFLDSSALGNIDFGYNYITDDGLEDNALQLLTALTSITLNHNRLTTVKAAWFKNMNTLTHVYLCCQDGSPKITSIETGAFQDLVNLAVVYLQENQIKELPFSIFDANNLPTSLDFYVYSNLLNCTCTVCWLKSQQYASSPWIEMSGSPTCTYGPVTGGWTSFNLNMLGCYQTCAASEMNISLIENAVSLAPNSSSGVCGSMYQLQCAPGILCCIFITSWG